jgi:uncharacterized protein YjbI with pentapeptide repeats
MQSGPGAVALIRAHSVLHEGFFGTGAEIEDADLSRLHLRGFDFSYLDLKTVNLSETNLSRSRFFTSSISRCDLSYTFAFGADFQEVIIDEETMMVGACFKNATFTNVSFERVKMDMACLCGAKLSKCTFEGKNSFKGVCHLGTTWPRGFKRPPLVKKCHQHERKLLDGSFAFRA